ncbi:MAG: D-aminoacylase [Deltaproteobacteria bacterium]|nr:D-aminoacylase [Deltaproteobacteria bacterium]
MLDLLIQQATVYDGSLKSAEVLDVAVCGDKIQKIAPHLQIKARQVIQAKGLVLSPGFIDVHSHSDYFILINPSAESKITQGVTSEIGGNCGYAAAPIWGEAQKTREAEYEKYYGLKLGWSDLKSYFARLEKEKIGLNYGQLVGHNTLRQSVMGVVNRQATDPEIKAMKQGLRQGLEQGAVGLSTGLIYPPACYADTREAQALANVCREFDAIFTFHMRSESDGLIEAVEEVLNIAETTGVRVQISHIKTSGERNWHKIDRVFELIEAAQKKGLDVACDRYPYIASQTGLMQVLPQWTFEGGPLGLVKTLQDPDNRKKIKDEILALHPLHEKYFEKVCIMEVMSEKNKTYVGCSIEKAAKKANRDSFEFLFDLLIEENAAISAIYFTMSEENLKRFIHKDYIFIASDAGCRATSGPLAKGAPHPRIFGTFPRVIKKYVRQEQTLTLSQAIYKMTGQPAERFQLQNRGFVREGYTADLVLFDEKKIQDRSDFFDPFHYAQGIEFVWVNGQAVIEKGKQTGVRPGKILLRGSRRSS